MNRSPVLVLPALLLLLLAAGCSDEIAATDLVDPGDDGYSYPVGKVFFTHPPIGLDGVFFFESMGALFTPYQEDHGGFFHASILGGTPTNPVIAPAAGQIIEIRTHEGQGELLEHAVRLQISTTIMVLWGHVGELSARLAAEAGPLGTSRDVAIPVEAGEVLGTVANTALDFAVNDKSIETALLHPEFYGSNPEAAPLEDYYREPLRSQIRALALRDADPRTGTMGHDVAGTLSGLWYRAGSDPRVFREDHAIHFGYNHLLSAQSTFIDGQGYVDATGGATPLWSFWIKGNPRWADVTPGSGTTKYEMYPSRSGLAGNFGEWTLEDTSGLDASMQTASILLVEMLDTGTLRVERFDALGGGGISPDDVTDFTANAQLFRRNPLG
jgi:hypothetical protein